MSISLKEFNEQGSKTRAQLVYEVLSKYIKWNTLECNDPEAQEFSDLPGSYDHTRYGTANGITDAEVKMVLARLMKEKKVFRKSIDGVFYYAWKVTGKVAKSTARDE